MKEYEEEIYYIPENFAQEGYIKSFKIINVIEAGILAALFAAIIYYIPISDRVTKIAVYIIVAGFPVLLSLHGISGDCLTKTIINFVHYRKNAKVYGPPTETYRRIFMRKKLIKQFKQTNKRKELKKGAKKNKLRKAGKGTEKTVSSTVRSEADRGSGKHTKRNGRQGKGDKGKP